MRGGAVRGSASGASVGPAPHEWRAFPCASCPPALITVETRHSVAASGRAGAHAFARVRNGNPHPVALAVAFVPRYTQHGDGYAPREVWVLRLGAAGGADSDTVLHLRRSDAVRAAVYDVERY